MTVKSQAQEPHPLLPHLNKMSARLCVAFAWKCGHDTKTMWILDLFVYSDHYEYLLD